MYVCRDVQDIVNGSTHHVCLSQATCIAALLIAYGGLNLTFE